MKTSLKALLMLFFIAATLSSCEQCGNVTITQPTAEDVKWLVYRQNDTIQFVTESNAPVTYTRTDVYAQNLPGEGYTATDECIEAVNVQLRTLVEDIKSEQPYFGTRVLAKPDDLVVELGVENGGVWEIDESTPTFATQTVNGKAYNNVYEVVTNNSGEGAVERILYNKEFGFLSIEFSGGKKLLRKP